MLEDRGAKLEDRGVKLTDSGMKFADIYRCQVSRQKREVSTQWCEWLADKDVKLAVENEGSD